MNNLNIQVEEFDFNQDFAWIITECGATVQVCIKNGEFHIRDAGLDWGCCGDANEEAFEKYGMEECFNAIVLEIEKCEYINIIK